MKNKLAKLPKESQEILKEATSMASALGVKIYLVGGVVRDLFLDKLNFDLDFVVEGDAMSVASCLAEKLGAKFTKHHTFGTATLYFKEHKIDFATARSEEYTHCGALPKVNPASLKEDLFRRDFTINAMAISLNIDDYGALVDFCEGAKDLKKGLIRILHQKSFIDDPTRILRAIRFEQRFSFKIEKNTFALMRSAIKVGLFKSVHPHRLRDELILILKEDCPKKYIKRLYELTAFSFIGRPIKLSAKDIALFSRVESGIKVFQRQFKGYRELESWVVYLSAIMVNYAFNEVVDFVYAFGFRKGESIRVISANENLSKALELKKKMAPHQVFEFLNPLSFETIMFYFGYFHQPSIRRAIKHFMDYSVNVRLKISGNDLKKIGVEPGIFYGKIFQELLYLKIDKKLTGKDQEKKEAVKIFQRLLGR